MGGRLPFGLMPLVVPLHYNATDGKYEQAAHKTAGKCFGVGSWPWRKSHYQ
jgi:hypothetical protein